MKTLFASIICVLMLTACILPDADPPPPPDTPVSSEPGEEPAFPPGAETPGQVFLPPQPGDEQLHQGQVYLDSTDVLLLESFPVQVNLLLKGSIPTPCHQARFVIQPPDSQNTIRIELYSLINPDQICVQVLQEFETNLSLGPLPAGHYILLINSESAAEFDI